MSKIYRITKYYLYQFDSFFFFPQLNTKQKLQFFESSYFLHSRSRKHRSSFYVVYRFWKSIYIVSLNDFIIYFFLFIFYLKCYPIDCWKSIDSGYVWSCDSVMIDIISFDIDTFYSKTLFKDSFQKDWNGIWVVCYCCSKDLFVSFNHKIYITYFCFLENVSNIICLNSLTDGCWWYGYRIRNLYSFTYLSNVFGNFSDVFLYVYSDSINWNTTSVLRCHNSDTGMNYSDYVFECR